jgi:hypothetical protein
MSTTGVLGSARVSRAGDGVLAVGKVTLTMQPALCF